MYTLPKRMRIGPSSGAQTGISRRRAASASIFYTMRNFNLIRWSLRTLTELFRVLHIPEILAIYILVL